MIKLTPIAAIYSIIVMVRAVKAMVNTATKPVTAGEPATIRMPPPNGVSR